MALDPSYFFYSDGTITLTNGSDIATGDLVAWDPAVLPFDFVFPQDGTAGMAVIKEVLAVNQVRLAKPWAGPNLPNVPYFMVRWANHIDPRFYAIRVSEYLTRVRDMPATGPNGWAPVPVPVPDGERRVLQIVDWVGGFGTKPATGGYLGPTGIVSDIAAATDIRGATGADSTVPGPQGDKGWSPVYAIVADGVRRVKQLVDYVGGTGTKPAVPANTYVGPTGYTTDISQATDERGPAGPAVSANSVDNTLLADMAAGTYKGRRPGTGTGDPVDITQAQLKTDLGISAFAETFLDDQDAATVRGTLGLLWKPIQSIQISTPVSAIDITVPAQVNRFVKITGVMDPTTAGSGAQTALCARISLDGTTFQSAAGSYSRAQTLRNGTTMSGFGQQADTFFVLALENEFDGIDTNFEAVFDIGSATKSVTLRAYSTNFFLGGTGMSQFWGAGWYGSALGRLQKIRLLLTGSSAFAAGTTLLVEGF